MGNSLSVSRRWCKDASQLSVGSPQRKTAEQFSARLFTFSICLASQKHLSFIYAFNQARPARRLGFWETAAPLHTSQSLTFILHCPIHLVCVAPKSLETLWHRLSHVHAMCLPKPTHSLSELNCNELRPRLCLLFRLRSSLGQVYFLRPLPSNLLCFSSFLCVSDISLLIHAARFFLFWTTDKKNIYTIWVAIISFVCAWTLGKKSSSWGNSFFCLKKGRKMCVGNVYDRLLLYV